MFAGKKSAQIREILINESAWEEMTCLFAPSLDKSEYWLHSELYSPEKVEELNISLVGMKATLEGIKHN